ncbi:MAG TPA: DUF882 domain-containing protein [Longimicrobiales bacterium]|nr:DUF882 domain-containing protein [Longimicrobiales bacterium]
MELAWYARPGISPKNEARFNAALGALLLAFVVGWSYAVYRSFAFDEPPPSLTSAITASPLSSEAPPAAAYLTDAAVNAFTSDLHGASGKVNVVVRKPGESITDSLPAGATIKYAEGSDTAAAAARPGVWNVLIAMKDAVRPVPNLTLLTLVPLSEKKNGRIGTYNIGSWPYERGGKPRGPQYAPPAGLIRVTPQNLNTQVSEHFRLGDFITKGQSNVWPKYVAMSPRLLDKLELVMQELNATGTPVTHVGVISAFRTPSYNESGGNPAGRAGLSRHMYGDAMDIFIDNNKDGRMDDLNKDGRIDTKDGRVIVNAAQSVERKNPELIGGVGLYAPTGAHSGFVHIDTRGYRARWGGA